MYCIILEETEEFVIDAQNELIAKGFSRIGSYVFIIQTISGFDNISRGLKDIASYKKQSSKNKIYKSSNLRKVN
jgi:hypothetical protein